MASEYDALLESTPAQKSEYDALLAQPSQPKSSVLGEIGTAIKNTAVGFVKGLARPPSLAEIALPIFGGQIERQYEHAKAAEQAIRTGQSAVPAIAQAYAPNLSELASSEATRGQKIQAGVNIAAEVAPFLVPALRGIGKYGVAGRSLSDIAFGAKPEPLRAETAAAEQIQKGGEISATQERVVKEGNIPKYPGDDTGRASTKTGGRGGNAPSPQAEAQAPQVAPAVPQPEQAQTGKPFTTPTVYHGTEADFTSFANEKISERAIAKGHFFADTPEAAGKYGTKLVTGQIEFKNPLVIDAEGRNIRAVMGAYEEGLARDAGHDGIIIKNVVDTPGWVMTTGNYQSVQPQTEYIAFDPKQIRRVAEPSPVSEGGAGIQPPISKEIKPVPVSQPTETTTSAPATAAPVTETKEIPEGLIEEGLHTEHPDVAAKIDRYVMNNDASGIFDALKDPGYEAYLADLHRLLRRFYGDEIPVSRVSGYATGGTGKSGGLAYVSVSTNPRWGEASGLKGMDVWRGTVKPEDVVLAGHEGEGELIVKKDAIKTDATQQAADMGILARETAALEARIKAREPAPPVSEAQPATTAPPLTQTKGGVSEEVQKAQDEGQGRQGVLAPEAATVQPPAAPPETPEELGQALKEPGRTAGVANRVLQERAAKGEIPQAPAAGEGHLTEDIINKSRAEYSPERALVAAENVRNGSLSEADAGQVRIHEEALTKVAANAEKALDADPKNPALKQAYETAKAALTQWHNDTVQPMKTTWSNAGKSMQGATDIDTGSYIGLQKLAWDTAKRDFTAKEEPVMKLAAKRVSKLTDDVRSAISKAEDQVQKVLKPSKYMDLNQLRESLAETLKSITC